MSSSEGLGYFLNRTRSKRKQRSQRQYRDPTSAMGPSVLDKKSRTIRDDDLEIREGEFASSQ